MEECAVGLVDLVNLKWIWYGSVLLDPTWQTRLGVPICAHIWPGYEGVNQPIRIGQI